MENESNKRNIQAYETKQKLLITSIKLILEHGYNNISVSRICSECNVAKGTFYIYFKSKKDIIVEILAEVNSDMFDKREWSTDLSPKERLLEYIRIYMNTIKKQGVDFTRETLKIMMDEKFEPEAVGSIKHVSLVQGILKTAKESGDLRPAKDIALLGRYLQNFIFGIMMDWCTNEENMDIVDFGNRAIEDYINTFFIEV